MFSLQYSSLQVSTTPAHRAVSLPPSLTTQISNAGRLIVCWKERRAICASKVRSQAATLRAAAASGIGSNIAFATSTIEISLGNDQSPLIPMTASRSRTPLFFGCEFDDGVAEDFSLETEDAICEPDTISNTLHDISVCFFKPVEEVRAVKIEESAFITKFNVLRAELVEKLAKTDSLNVLFEYHVVSREKKGSKGQLHCFSSLYVFLFMDCIYHSKGSS